MLPARHFAAMSHLLPADRNVSALKHRPLDEGCRSGERENDFAGVNPGRSDRRSRLQVP